MEHKDTVGYAHRNGRDQLQIQIQIQILSVFQLVATTELTWLFHVLLYANTFRLVPASPVNECGADLYHRILLTHRYLLLTALAAGALLLAVKAAARAAEARALAAAKALQAGHEGIGSVAAGWKRRSLRGTLLLAVALSFAASVLAKVTFEDGFLYRIGFHDDHVAGYGFGTALGVLVVGLFALLHGLFA